MFVISDVYVMCGMGLCIAHDVFGVRDVCDVWFLCYGLFVCL